jgi:shikimate kinase
MDEQHKNLEIFPDRIFVVGFMGSGKSTVAKKLANAMGYYFVDLDDLIERTSKKKVSEIFKDGGEAYFRKVESESLRTLNSLKQIVIATGGGTPCFKENMEWMNENGFTLWLNADWDIMMSRLSQAKKNQRPLFEQKSRSELKELFERRIPFYQRAKLKVASSETEKNSLLKNIQTAFLK